MQHCRDGLSKPEETLACCKSQTATTVHETNVYRLALPTNVTLTSSQCKTTSVILISILHPDVEVSYGNNPKKTWNRFILQHHQSGRWSGRSDVKKIFSKSCQQKTASAFDLALINKLAFYEAVCKSKLSRREYVKQAFEESLVRH